MPDKSLPEGATPELPITLNVDGNIKAVDFIRRLHRSGLELRNAEDGSYAVIVMSEHPPQPELGARGQLFEASGIVHAVRAALDCSDHIEIDEVQLASALAAVGRIIDDGAAQLEGHDHE